jgi:predicted permease
LAVGGVVGETALGGDVPQKIYGALVSCNYFNVLQQPPALGRGLTDHDCARNPEPVVVLGHDLWRTAFAANPGIVGQTIELNRRRVVVAGVAAEGTYQGPIRLGYFAPINAGSVLTPGDSRLENGKFLWLSLIGRQREGANLEQVRAELDVIAADIDRQQPGRSTTLTVGRARPTTVPPGVRGRATAIAAVLMAAFGFILLMACANVANLLLARGTTRGQEIGIRQSLGASRARVIRQLLTESVLISLAGGAVGSVLAVWSFQTLVTIAVPSLIPPELPMVFAWDLSPDVRVIAFAAAVTVLTTALFGLAPAMRISKPDLRTVTRQESAGTSANRREGRLRGVLVGVQVALCMVLMIAAGLLLRGLYVTYTIDPGFDYRNVAFVSLESAFDGYSPEAATALRRRMVAAVEAVPDVEAVASADQEPLGDDFAPIAIRLPGESAPRHGEIASVSESYFATLGLPIVRGRAFTSSEVVNQRPGTTHPAVVSEATARNLWPGGDAIGRTFRSDTDTFEVVGVAADAQVSVLGEIDPYYVYQPGGGAALLVKSRIDSAAIASSVRAAIRSVDPALAVTVLPLETNLGWWRGVSATATTLAGGLGTLALVLAAVGIYGVVSYTVTGRHREIGVRMALGATASNVLSLVLGHTMRPVVAGAAIGIAVASALSRVLSSVLFGVSTVDPIGLGGGVLLVLGVALAAGAMATWPAIRTDPTTTLR